MAISPERRSVLIALLVAVAYFMENLDGTVIATALPQMAVTFGKQAVDLNIGMSAYHLASPKVTFMSNQQLTVPTRITWNGVYEARLGDMVSISLLGMYSKQEQASEGVFGTILTIGKSWREFDKTPVFYAGMLYRTKDALIPYVAAEYLDIRLGVSYDYNNSSLNAATKGQGGAEISLSYLLRIPPNKKIIYLCPNNPKF